MNSTTCAPDVIWSLSEIPCTIRRCPFVILEPDETYTSRYVTGRVSTLFPLFGPQTAASCETVAARIKLMLEDTDTKQTLPVVFFGTIAHKVASSVSEGALLAVSGFDTELQHRLGETAHGAQRKVLIVLGHRPSLEPRIWLIQPPNRKGKLDAAVRSSGDILYTNLKGPFNMGERYNFYGVVLLPVVTSEKRNTVMVVIVDPTVQSFTCVIQGWSRSSVTVQPGDVLRARNATVARRRREKRALVASNDVVIYKARSGDGSMAGFDHSGSSSISENDKARVTELVTWNAKCKTECLTKRVFTDGSYLEFNPESDSTLSSLVPYASFDVTCVVVALWHNRNVSLAVLDVWDGSTPKQNIERPADVFRPHGQASHLYNCLKKELVPVCVIGTHINRALELAVGSHVQLRGLTFRRGKLGDQQWVVVETRFSNQGIVRLANPCIKLAKRLETQFSSCRCGRPEGVQGLQDLSITQMKVNADVPKLSALQSVNLVPTASCSSAGAFQLAGGDGICKGEPYSEANFADTTGGSQDTEFSDELFQDISSDTDHG